MKIAIIGAGNMGGAIARGLAHGNLDVKIAVADLAQDKLAELNVECNCVETSTDSNAIVADADVVLVAVKPWLVEPVLKGALPLLDLKRQIILSIAAGVDIATITEWLGDENAIVFRAIPNTAISIHQSMTCDRGAVDGSGNIALLVWHCIRNALCSCGNGGRGRTWYLSQRRKTICVTNFAWGD